MLLKLAANQNAIEGRVTPYDLYWFKARAGEGPEDSFTPHDLDLRDEIDILYEEIAQMASESMETTVDAVLEERIQSAWSKLRSLQTEEAHRFREAFEASLAMPLDAGAKILDELRALRKSLENPTSSDTPP